MLTSTIMPLEGHIWFFYPFSRKVDSSRLANGCWTTSPRYTHTHTNKQTWPQESIIERGKMAVEPG